MVSSAPATSRGQYASAQRNAAMASYEWVTGEIVRLQRRGALAAPVAAELHAMAAQELAGRYDELDRFVSQGQASRQRRPTTALTPAEGPVAAVGPLRVVGAGGDQ